MAISGAFPVLFTVSERDIEGALPPETPRSSIPSGREAAFGPEFHDHSTAAAFAVAGVIESGATTVAEVTLTRARAEAANALMREGEETINALGRQWGNTTDAQLGGRVSEEFHAVTFSACAANQGREGLQAVTTASQGAPGAAADIHILDGADVVGSAQLKYHGTPAQTARTISAPEYGDMQKVVPADQLSGVQQTATREAARNSVSRPEQAAQYEHTAENVSDRLHHEGVESNPLTGSEARQLARSARKGEAQLPRFHEPDVVKEIAAQTGRAALVGGAVGAGVTTLIAGTMNAIRVHDGELSGKEAVVKTLEAAGTSALESGVKAGGAVLLKSVAPSLAAAAPGALGTVVKTMARGGGPVAIAAVTVDAGAAFVQLARGKIDGEECAKRVGESASSAGGGLAGAAAGAALGSVVPILGTVVGGAIGGVLGSLGCGAAFRALFR